MQLTPCFRTATQSDAARVTLVYLTSRKTFVSFAPIAHSDEAVYSWIRDILIPTGRVTVVEQAGKIVGMMALSVDESNEAIGWIDHLYLLPEAVGHRIGTALLNRAKSELGPSIRLYTFQANVGARRFYERHGFKAIQYGNGSSNEEHCPDVLYEWSC
ncbi:MAG: GNAT family N-acetyltransferase [Leptolyngbyaceae cyanobacterium SM1_4_3]|nr:GNAT family N-acetyltransferase [Leptolyngbyaceae cyanobacterium SM1_4_3]